MAHDPSRPLPKAITEASLEDLLFVLYGTLDSLTEAMMCDHPLTLTDPRLKAAALDFLWELQRTGLVDAEFEWRVFWQQLKALIDRKRQEDGHA